MSNIANNPIQGVIFDYGGTIDTDAMHWAEAVSYTHLTLPTKALV